jgi:tetratricopeptide (TPR) repeat protein
VFARGISTRAFSHSGIQASNSTQQLEEFGVHYGSVISRENFVPFPDGHGVNGLVNGPKNMRRANELGIGSVLLFAAAVLSCHAQAASGCALPQGFQSRASADPFTAWDSVGTWYAQRKDLRCASIAYNKALQLNPQAWETFYDLGVVEVAQKKPASAILHLRRAVDLKPDSVDARNALGMTLKDSGQPAEAEKQFREILKADPNSVDALNHLAEALAAQKLYSAATGYWDKALSLDPGNVDAGIARAIALSENGDQDAATASLQQIVKTHPGLAVAHFNLGTVYANQKSFRQAADEFREASRLSPADPEARFALAKCLVFLAEYAEAIPILKAYLPNHPKAFEPHYLLGLSYRGLEQYPQAEQQLHSAAAIDPDHADLQYNLGLVILRSGRAKEAVPHLQKAIKLDPAAEGPRLQLAIALKGLNQTQQSAKVYQDVRQTEQANLLKNQFTTEGAKANQLLASGQAAQAAEVYRQMLQIQPRDAHTYYNLSLALDLDGKFPAERQALETAIKLDPTLAQARSKLGVLDMSQGHPDDAIQNFKKAIELDPQLTEAQLNLATIFDGRGQVKEAESLLRQATEEDPKYAQARFNLGMVLAQQQRFSEAEAELQTAVSLDGTNLDAQTALAEVRAREGKSESSIEILRKVVAARPDSFQDHLNLGIALADHLEVEAALAEFTQAVTLNPGSAVAHYNRGRLLLDERHFEEAKPELEKALSLYEHFGDAVYLLAVTERQLGETAKSLELSQKSVQLSPDNPRAYYLLGQNLSSAKREQEAIAAWKHAAQLDPNSTEVLNRLSQVFHATDPPEAAKYAALLKARLAEQQATSQADITGNLALEAAKNHDYAQAITELQKAIEICGECRDQATLKKDLGLIEARSGDLAAAAQQLKAAASLNPADPEIKQALAMVLPHQGKLD